MPEYLLQDGLGPVPAFNLNPLTLSPSGCIDVKQNFSVDLVIFMLLFY